MIMYTFDPSLCNGVVTGGSLSWRQPKIIIRLSTLPPPTPAKGHCSSSPEGSSTQLRTSLVGKDAPPPRQWGDSLRQVDS